MINTNFNNGTIGNLLEKYLKVKVIKARTLFPATADWRKIETDNCPFCGRRIYIIMKTGRRYCKNKKCPTDTKFTMSEKDYEILKSKIRETK